MFLRGCLCTDRRDQLVYLFELASLSLQIEFRLENIFFERDLLHVVSSVVRRGQEMFCDRYRFRSGVRVSMVRRCSFLK